MHELDGFFGGGAWGIYIPQLGSEVFFFPSILAVFYVLHDFFSSVQIGGP